MRLSGPLVSSVVLLFLWTPSVVPGQDSAEVARKCVDAVKSIRSLSYDFIFIADNGPRMAKVTGTAKVEIRGSFVSDGLRWTRTDLSSIADGVPTLDGKRQVVFDGQVGLYASFPTRDAKRAEVVKKVAKQPMHLPQSLEVFLGLLLRPRSESFVDFLPMSEGSKATLSGVVVDRFELGKVMLNGERYDTVVFVDSRKSDFPLRIEGVGEQVGDRYAWEVTRWANVSDQLAGQEVMFPVELRWEKSSGAVEYFVTTNLALNAPVSPSAFRIPLERGATIVDETKPGVSKTSTYAPGHAVP